MKKLSEKWMSSERGITRIMGAMIYKWWWLVTLLFFVMAALSLLSLYNWQNCLNSESHLIRIHDFIAMAIRSKWYKIIFLTITASLVFGVCNTLTNIFTLRKNENGITWCQIFILLGIGLWIIGFIWIFDIQKSDKSAAVFGIVGALLAWIFQDKVKGAIAFLHLRLHHLLNIDDWIQVPKYNVDGEVKRVSLTTVTIYNWDTTTSTIPISALHSDHFINLQNMMEGKTYGRRMFKSFVLDTGWFHALSKDEAEQLNKQFEEDGTHAYLPESEIHEGVLNAHLYRMYLYHWLMNHPHISQQPRLVVRWLEQVDSGLPLQVYAFIIDSNLSSFEWQQSQIIEHIIESLDWFCLRLYQSPSAYDAGNCNVYMTDKPANYRKEAEQ